MGSSLLIAFPAITEEVSFTPVFNFKEIILNRAQADRIPKNDIAKEESTHRSEQMQITGSAMFRIFISMHLCCLGLIGAISASAEDCEPIRQLERHALRTGYAETSAKYCLTYDIVQPRVFSVESGGLMALSGAPMIAIQYRNEYPDKVLHKLMRNPLLSESSVFDIDLQGHLLKSEVDNLLGVVAWDGIRHVKVRNAIIDVPGKRNSLGVSLENGDGSLSIAGLPSYANQRVLATQNTKTFPRLNH
ncbi:hypothetical protein BCF11_1822 [Collimonas sp. PA-H2]|nr:hypothetical protein BCF11_1822 [Collimonas sp. PA-H2]